MSETLQPPTPFARLVTRLVFVFFILYCIEAGIFLVWSPWTGFWDSTFISLPWEALGRWMLAPWARGAVSGFGLVHLLWGIHDLERWLVTGGRRVRLTT